MNKRILALCVGCMLVALVVPAVLQAGADLIVPVQISPSTIVKSAPVTWVTVHADIGYGLVDPDSVKLEGIVATTTFADNRGDLVAKFKFAEINAIVSAPQATLTLTGMTKDVTAFSGTATVAVRK